MEMSVEAIVSLVVGSGIINTLFSHILYSVKLKKELKNMGNDSVAKKILNSLDYVRDVELKLKEYEIFDIENLLKNEDYLIDFFNGEAKYMSIFNDKKSFVEFCDLIRECRIKHEQNLNCKIALNLAYIENYLLMAIQFIKKHGDEKLIRFWGAILIFDLQRWQVKMDKMLVKEINSHNYKLVSHETIKWRLLRKFEIVKQYENTTLYCLCNECKSNKKARENKTIMTMYYEILNEVNKKKK